MTGIHPITRAKARKLRHEMTPEERKVWAKLRELNRMLGLHFRRQAPIGPFIADFADLGRRVVIEVDGGGHGGPRDVARDEWLASQGFQVLRFWNLEVSGNIDGVMQVIFDAVDGESLAEGVTHSPSPRRGRGAIAAGVGDKNLIEPPVAGAPPPHPSPTRGEGGSYPLSLRGTVEPGASPPPCGEEGALGLSLRGTVDPGASPPPRGEGMGVGGTRPEGSAP